MTDLCRQLRPAPPWARAGAVLGLLYALANPATAQTQAAVPANAALVAGLRGTTLDGQDFNLDRLRGKVVMLLFWSTTCSVCMSKMPELRANAAGWRGKPFELVLVNTDATRTDVDVYARMVRLIEPDSPRVAMLWSGNPGFAGSLAGPLRRLPLTIVLDVTGKVVARHEGRMAPELWDAVADLMP